MAIATDQQVQRYADERVRPWAEAVRSLRLLAYDHKAAFDDVYEALTQPDPTWTDQRTDAPPHLLTGDDILAWGTFVTCLLQFIDGGLTDNGAQAQAQWPVVLDCCVRPPGV